MDGTRTTREPAAQIGFRPGPPVARDRVMQIVWVASSLVGLIASSVIVFEFGKWHLEERRARRATRDGLDALPGYARPGYATGYLDGMAAAKSGMAVDDLEQAFPGAHV